MKLSFSTVGCPRWHWYEITSAAKDLGYDGVEVRGVGDDLYIPDIKVFSNAHLPETKAELKTLGLEIPCLSSEVCLHAGGANAEEALTEYIRLAALLGAPNIRVLGDSWAYPGENVDLALVERRLKALAPEAERSGVRLLVESNGVLADSKRLKALVEAVESPAVGVLWDIHHPVRYAGETISETFSNIGKYVGHVHVKDSVVENGKIAYKMIGYGTLPLAGAFQALKDAGYKGYLSMEWVKRWNEELEEPGVVFAHYIYKIKKYLSELK